MLYVWYYRLLIHHTSMTAAKDFFVPILLSLAISLGIYGKNVPLMHMFRVRPFSQTFPCLNEIAPSKCISVSCCTLCSESSCPQYYPKRHRKSTGSTLISTSHQLKTPSKPPCPVLPSDHTVHQCITYSSSSFSPLSLSTYQPCVSRIVFLGPNQNHLASSLTHPLSLQA